MFSVGFLFSTKENYKSLSKFTLTKQQLICGNSTPIADFEIEPTTISALDPTVTFFNTSSPDATIFSWDFGDDKNSKEKNRIKRKKQCLRVRMKERIKEIKKRLGNRKKGETKN